MPISQPSRKPASESVLIKLEQLEEKTVSIFKEYFGTDLSKDSKSIKYLCEFISANSGELEAEEQDAWLNLIGAFLGQTIIEVYQGRWIEIDISNNNELNFELNSPCIELHDGSVCFPFAKVQKQFENGIEDSIHSYFAFFATYLKKN